MVDDMKKLVEKYKRELMEYNRVSSSEKPSPFHFPDMIADPPEEGGADNMPSAQVPQQPPLNPQTTASAPDNATPSGNDIIRDFSAESADRLPETPESGQPSETRNPRSDIKPLVTQTNGAQEMQPEREYADLQDFNNINNKRGTLRFRVYTAREALPVTGAVIEVTKVIGNNKHTFYKLTTDISGNTPIVYLPAPSSELSQQPENTIQPYALYDVYITADNFRDVSIKNLPVFDGVLSEQSIAMTPMIAVGGTPRQIVENGPGVNGGVY